jgi:hypothetical protein
MPERTRRLLLLGLAVGLLPLAMPGAAFAQSREFSGKITEIGKKNVVVDSRMGEKVRFLKTDATVVSDQRPPGMKQPAKLRWGDLRVGDSVAIEWRLSDKPRKAYRVIVLPPRKGGEEGR